MSRWMERTKVHKLVMNHICGMGVLLCVSCVMWTDKTDKTIKIVVNVMSSLLLERTSFSRNSSSCATNNQITVVSFKYLSFGRHVLFEGRKLLSKCYSMVSFFKKTPILKALGLCIQLQSVIDRFFTCK